MALFLLLKIANTTIYLLRQDLELIGPHRVVPRSQQLVLRWVFWPVHEVVWLYFIFLIRSGMALLGVENWLVHLLLSYGCFFSNWIGFFGILLLLDGCWLVRMAWLVIFVLVEDQALHVD